MNIQVCACILVCSDVLVCAYACLYLGFLCVCTFVSQCVLLHVHMYACVYYLTNVNLNHSGGMSWHASMKE